MNMTPPPAFDNTSPADAARSYLTLGMELMRVHPLSKAPVGDDWQTRPGITDPAHASITFNDPDQNIGFKPGENFAVIDIDTKHAGKGQESWGEVNERLGPFPATVEAITASGGGLRIYRVPAGAGLTFQKRMLGLPDLEFRVGAVNCILPPSRVRYKPGELGPEAVVGQHKWEEGHAPGEIEFAELPAVVIEALRAYEPKTPAINPKSATKVKGTGGTVSAMLNDQAKKAAIAKAKPDSLASVLAGCAWMQHCEADAANLSEPEWHAELSISARCENGRELSHKLSEPYAGYSYQETEDKIDHALNDAGPVTCKKVADEFGFEGCTRCPFRASIKSPMSLANQPRALVQEQRQAVYILEMGRWLNLTTGRFLSREAFGDAIQARVGKAPHSLMMSSKSTAKVEAMDYLAGVSQLILRQEDGSLAVNLWQQGGVKAAAGDPKPILDYLARFIPDTRSREHVMQYLAHLIQRPGEKIEHGVIITGGFGTGKGTLRAILRIMLGARNVKKIEGEELSDKNNVDWVNRQVIIFEEAIQGGKFEVYNRTKELVTDETFRVQGKWIPLHDGRTPRGIFIMSNDNSPIMIPPHDRRWFLCDTPETPETDEEKAVNTAYFKTFRNLIECDPATVAAFKHHLFTEVSLKGFTAKGAPPTTAAKKRATAESRTPAAQVLEDLISVGASPFDRDVVSGAQVLEAIRHSGWAHTVERVSLGRVGGVIRSVGGFPVNVMDGEQMQVRVTRTLAPRLWGLRNKAKWANASTDEVRTEWLGGKPAAEAEVVQLRDRGLSRAMSNAS